MTQEPRPLKQIEYYLLQNREPREKEDKFLKINKRDPENLNVCWQKFKNLKGLEQKVEKNPYKEAS